MTEFAVAAAILDALRAYVVVGAVVAAAFLMFGIHRYDLSARGAYLFRPLIAPGVILLWPLVALRWRSLEAAKRRET